MASAPRAARLCVAACRRAAPQLSRPRVMASTTASTRATTTAATFSTTSIRAGGRRFDGDDGDASSTVELTQLNKAFTDRATPEGLRQLDQLAKMNGHDTIEAYLDDKLRYTPGFASQDRTLTDELVRDDNSPKKADRRAFWFDEDDPDMLLEEHDEFDEDDMMAMAHSKLDEVREMRHYTRLAVWEMPLLSKLAKPFELPKKDQVLRWRYTTYMGEAHPAENKVVVQFAPQDLGLSAVQADKLRKLAGARHDPARDLIKMSCDRYEHQAQNKQYLQELVNSLIAEAKDGQDTFADVALDTRHYFHATKATKQKPRFPTEWRMTEERQRQLAEVRAQAVLAETERAAKGLVVDGQQRIDGFLMQKLVQEEKAAAEVVAIPAGRAPARARR